MINGTIWNSIFEASSQTSELDKAWLLTSFKLKLILADLSDIAEVLHTEPMHVLETMSWTSLHDFALTEGCQL